MARYNTAASEPPSQCRPRYFRLGADMKLGNPHSTDLERHLLARKLQEQVYGADPNIQRSSNIISITCKNS
jgi:hypothetical protein